MPVGVLETRGQRVSAHRPWPLACSPWRGVQPRRQRRGFASLADDVGPKLGRGDRAAGGALYDTGDRQSPCSARRPRLASASDDGDGAGLGRGRPPKRLWSTMKTPFGRRSARTASAADGGWSGPAEDAVPGEAAVRGGDLDGRDRRDPRRPTASAAGGWLRRRLRGRGCPRRRVGHCWGGARPPRPRRQGQRRRLRLDGGSPAPCGP